jgi:hypothetical protein
MKLPYGLDRYEWFSETNINAVWNQDEEQKPAAA